MWHAVLGEHWVLRNWGDWCRGPLVGETWLQLEPAGGSCEGMEALASHLALILVLRGRQGRAG